MTITKVRLVKGDIDGEEVYAYQLPDGSILQPTVQVDITGAPVEAATETTMGELKGVAEAISTAAAAIQAAVEALDAKAIEINTGDVAGTVNVSNLPEIQAVSLSSIPLPAGAATDATVAAIRDMEDTLVTQLQTIANKMGGVNRSGILEVTTNPSAAMTANSAQNAPNASNSVCRTNGLADTSPLQLLFRVNEPFQTSNMGALHLYNGITIS